ncbi:MAG: CPBP family intramembrane metalloprotease [Myxococcales bacterium]|nr:CPBP family intramembrane metalloprotease [Myxococcales bacterium]
MDANDELRLRGPRLLWWALAAAGIVLPLLLAMTGSAPDDATTGVQLSVRMRTLLWRAQAQFGPTDPADARPPGARARGPAAAPGAEPIPTDLVDLFELARTADGLPALTPAAPGRPRMQAAELVVAHAFATRADAAARILARQIATPSADLRAILVVLATAPTATAPTATAPTASGVPAHLADAADHVLGRRFGAPWGSYLRDRVRARVLQATGRNDDARPILKALHTADGRMAAAFVTVVQVLALAAVIGLGLLAVALVRSNVARRRGEPPWQWLRGRYPGLPPGPAYLADPLVPALGLSTWLVGYAGAALLVASLPGERFPAGLATLFQAGTGILLAHAVIHAFAHDQPALARAARFGATDGPSFWQASTAALRAWCVLLPVVALALLASALLFGGDGNAHPVARYLLDDADPVQLGALGLAVAAGAPLGEELLFRGFLYRVLRQHWGPGRALAATALGFAALHMAPQALIPYTLLGLAFGLVYEWTGSLWASIVLHGLWNLGVFALLGLVVLS